MNNEKKEIGLVGLGVMGKNLAMNILDSDYSLAAYDKKAAARHSFRDEIKDRPVSIIDRLQALSTHLKTPRTVIILVPAGGPVDSVLRRLNPYLEENDIVIDAGNSHFSDTERRAKKMEKGGIRYFGAGISGGASGARHGPSIMPGGPEEAYDGIRGLLERLAAKVDGEPCVAWLGPGSAGHYVKMVHNGIEYGLMQLIAETYDLMWRGLGMSESELRAVYARWAAGDLGSFLLSITAEIFDRKDGASGRPLIEVIVDEASQKGTGKWMSSDALELQVPVPTIDMAVAMRNLSSDKPARQKAALAFKRDDSRYPGDREQLIRQLGRALHAASLLTYSQGFAQLRLASEKYGYEGLDQAEVARIWRGGCIIRSAVLEKIRQAFRRDKSLENLILDPGISAEISGCIKDMRTVVCAAAELGLPAPAFMTSLAYFDALRSGWLPANLIQAQRDYFGSHGYQRIDRPGWFHTEWEAA